MTIQKELDKDAIRAVITLMESWLDDGTVVTGGASLQRETEIREVDNESRWVEYERTGRERVAISFDVWVSRVK